MVFAKRIILFLLVNLLVISTLSFLLYLFNVQPFLTQHGLNLESLIIFCLIWGMGGALISLALSKMMAKWMMGVQVIDPHTRDPQLNELLQTVYRLSKMAGLPAMPEVGVYRSAEVNAFATGPTKSHALVAVSSGLLQRMRHEEVEGVLGHEITHIANGDMVSMTLLQGVINAFVMFFARIIALIITRGIGRDRRSDIPASPLAFHMITMLLEITFMFLGMLVIARFSRYREFRADAGGARLAGKEKMISALRALQRVFEIKNGSSAQPAFQIFKISSREKGWAHLFATHPPLEERIARLERLSLR